jgi:3-methyladenine DNA glycosylase AlkD
MKLENALYSQSFCLWLCARSCKLIQVYCDLGTSPESKIFDYQVHLSISFNINIAFYQWFALCYKTIMTLIRYNLKTIQKEFHQLADPKRAEWMIGYFKAEPGMMAQEDLFLGIRMPQIHECSKKWVSLGLQDCSKLIQSNYHEERMLGLRILVQKLKMEDPVIIATFYLDHLDGVNHWDLVDQTAPYILGPLLSPNRKSKELLKNLTGSADWWKRRVAIVATLHLIRKNEFDLTFYLADILLKDSHDLVQKAVGWMIKEVSKKDLQSAKEYLEQRKDLMPRSMIRNATEKFPKGYNLGL